MLPDVNSLAMLDPVRLKASWKDDVSRITDHYNFTSEQRDKAQKILDESLHWADYWFDDPENVEKISRSTITTSVRCWRPSKTRTRFRSRKKRAWDARRSVDADRRSLIQPLVDQENSAARGRRQARAARPGKAAGRDEASDVRSGSTKAGISSDSLQSKLGGLRRSVGPVSTCSTAMTMYRADRDRVLPDRGFLTPLAALRRGRFLAMIYLSMPPWPGTAPQPEGRGALPDREQKPGRVDRVPGDRHNTQRSLGRSGCTFLRCAGAGDGWLGTVAKRESRGPPGSMPIRVG